MQHKYSHIKCKYTNTNCGKYIQNICCPSNNDNNDMVTKKNNYHYNDEKNANTESYKKIFINNYGNININN